jgi:hypothetical protein
LSLKFNQFFSIYNFFRRLTIDYFRFEIQPDKNWAFDTLLFMLIETEKVLSFFIDVRRGQGDDESGVPV